MHDFLLELDLLPEITGGILHFWLAWRPGVLCFVSTSRSGDHIWHL